MALSCKAGIKILLEDIRGTIDVIEQGGDMGSSEEIFMWQVRKYAALIEAIQKSLRELK